MTEAPSDAIGLSDRLLAEIGQPVIYRNDAVLREAATALDALQARVAELEATLFAAQQALLSEGQMRIVAESRATSAEQERDEAYERAAKVALAHVSEPGLSDNPAYIHFEPSDMMARKIAAAIRRLAAGTEKEGK